MTRQHLDDMDVVLVFQQVGGKCDAVGPLLAIGYGATRLSSLFARSVAWKWIDGMTVTTVLALSVSVAMG